jgi:hypothetical protein
MSATCPDSTGKLAELQLGFAGPSFKHATEDNRREAGSLPQGMAGRFVFRLQRNWHVLALGSAEQARPLANFGRNLGPAGQDVRLSH